MLSLHFQWEPVRDDAPLRGSTVAATVPVLPTPGPGGMLSAWEASPAHCGFSSAGDGSLGEPLGIGCWLCSVRAAPKQPGGGHLTSASRFPLCQLGVVMVPDS